MFRRCVAFVTKLDEFIDTKGMARKYMNLRNPLLYSVRCDESLSVCRDGLSQTLNEKTFDFVGSPFLCYDKYTIFHLLSDNRSYSFIGVISLSHKENACMGNPPSSPFQRQWISHAAIKMQRSQE